MAGASEVLREYLLKLGFQVDYQQTKKFDNTIGGIGKSASWAGLKVAGLATTVAAMAQIYANSMTKMYYTARHTNSTVASLSALSYAGEKVGISQGRMQAAVEGVSRAMRNPGTLNYMSMLTKRTVSKDEDPAQLVIELGKAISELPWNQANKGSAADLVGLDPEILVDIQKNLPELAAGMKEFNDRTKAAGIDLDAVGKATQEWNNSLIRVRSTIGTLEGAIAMKLLGPMHQLEKATEGWMDQLTKDVASSDTLGELINKRREASIAGGEKGLPWGDDASISVDVGSLAGKAKDWLLGFTNGGRGPKGGSSTSSGGEPKPDTSGMFGKTGYTKKQIDDAISNYADAYSVPEEYIRGILKVESNDGTNLVSPTGVRGITQVNAKNAKRLGGNREDAMDSLRMTAQMLQENSQGGKRSWDEATSMYGNGTYSIGHAGPGGDPNYVDKVHRAIQQTNNITVNGGDAHAIRASVEGALATSNGNLVRDMTGAVR